MTNKTRYQRNPNFIYRKVVDESVLVPIHNDVADMACIYTLNAVGAFIWEQLEEPLSLADLQTEILETFEAEPDALQSDLTEFLDEMLEIRAVKKV